MTEINKDMTIGDILDAERDTAPFFLEMGMHCLGCPASRGETESRLVWFTVLNRTCLLRISTNF